jgi:hypothetical protein
MLAMKEVLKLTPFTNKLAAEKMRTGLYNPNMVQANITAG